MPKTEANARAELAREYAGALRDYVRNGGEAALNRAYELGRNATAAGINMLEMSLIHHEALRGLTGHGWSESNVLTSASQFFSESLSPFEMTLRGYQANARLLGLGDTLAKNNEALQRANEAAEAANRELESFSYSVSHDLRAPLRAIDGFSDILRKNYAPNLDETGRGYLDRIRAAARRMAELIDDLLQLSRIVRCDLERRPTNLSDIARSVIDELARNSPDRKVMVRIQDGIVVAADHRLMRIVLENLLGNAWKFTSKKPDAQIEFGARPGDAALTYFVHDNGAGFSMEYVAKLFQPFQRLHAEHDFAGTGIGLATVRRVIERHGGQVYAEAEVNRGATFFFTLGEKETEFEP